MVIMKVYKWNQSEDTDCAMDYVRSIQIFFCPGFIKSIKIYLDYMVSKCPYVVCLSLR